VEALIRKPAKLPGYFTGESALTKEFIIAVSIGSGGKSFAANELLG
jgi:hypothetical protein